MIYREDETPTQIIFELETDLGVKVRVTWRSGEPLCLSIEATDATVYAYMGDAEMEKVQDMCRSGVYMARAAGARTEGGA